MQRMCYEATTLTDEDHNKAGYAAAGQPQRDESDLEDLIT